ncbi:dihydrodipicolinate reductase C-terminal domain-containing protein [Desulfomicrobium escambiense]|uniref:dihydrodipicolinate reductase C-terminal domain-containing protein n=1 Tax=Desulfomicrobium escambiense TaxID=29503 RepID=UPI0003FC4B38|nr:dihydrodipicolinate reductase C-terminal domain-containing protein [Desulfomicrobium escambiense]
MTETYTILIVGRGRLAAELLHGLQGPGIGSVLPWDERTAAGDGPCMVVHAGSGRELGDVFDFCGARGTVLLDLSTAGTRYPAEPGFPLVVCPNVNMIMLSFMAMVRQAAGYFRGLDIAISESHQAAKKTSPGTAVHLATSLGVPAAVIRSERDPQVQREVIGIPEKFLDRHAYHDIVIRDEQVEIRMQTRVLGKTAYATGLARVIGIVSSRRPSPGCHDIVDLILGDA